MDDHAGLATYLDAVAADVPSALIGAAQWALLRDLACLLPPTSVSGFEVRLNGDPRVDMSIAINRTDGRREALATGRLALPAVLLARPTWTWIVGFCAAWSEPALRDRIGLLFLEFDIKPDGSDTLTPALFFGNPEESKSDAILNLDLPMRNDSVAQVRALMDHLPPPAWLRTLGLWLSRPDAPLHCSVWDLSRAHLHPFLDQIGWIRPRGAIERAFDLLGEDIRLGLAFDLDGARVTRMGIIGRVPGPILSMPYWFSGLTARLEAAGQCGSTQRAALEAWPGETNVPMDPFSGRPGKLARRVSYFKMVVDGDDTLHTKAYFGMVQR